MSIRSFKRRYRYCRLLIGGLLVLLVSIGLIYTNINNKNQLPELPFPKMKHDTSVCTAMGTDRLALDDILKMPLPDFLPTYKNPCFSHGAHRELKCLPYFMFIGSDKCGTTDLFFKIMQHPDVVNNTGDLNGKETLWWSWKRYGYGYYWFNDKPMESFHQYLNYFRIAASLIETRVDESGFHHTITADGSVGDFWDFTRWPQIHQNIGLREPRVLTPHLIKHISPNTKFLLMFREPVERLYSDFFYWNFHPLSREKFHEQVVYSLRLLQQCQSKNGLKHCLFNRDFHCKVTVRVHLGIYWIYLQEWLKVFSKNQFLILRMDDSVHKPKSTIKKVFRFLELANVPDAVLDTISSRKPLYVTKFKSRPMLNKTKELLQAFYRPHNVELARILRDTKFRWTY